MKINKAELTKIYADTYNISTAEAKERLDQVAEVIVSQLEAGNDVMLNNFFNFKVRERKAKRAKDLHTGEPTIIPATKTVIVQMSSSTKRRIKGE